MDQKFVLSKLNYGVAKAGWYLKEYRHEYQVCLRFIEVALDSKSWVRIKRQAREAMSCIQKEADGVVMEYPYTFEKALEALRELSEYEY